MGPVRLYLDEDLSQHKLPCERELDPQDRHHFMEVLRLKTNTPIAVLDKIGEAFDALLIVKKGNLPSVKIIGKNSKNPVLVSYLKCTVFQAPPRAGHMDDLLRPLSELGAYRIHPVQTERGVLRLKKEAWNKRLERWRRIAKESAKQCGRKKPMQIGSFLSFQEAIAMANQYSLAFLLTPEEENFIRSDELIQKIQNQIADKPGKSSSIEVALFVGPEGGFSEQERTKAKDHQWIPLCLNPHILRCETAAPAAMAILQYVVI